jgi:excisionase family DNA binding protein
VSNVTAPEPLSPMLGIEDVAPLLNLSRATVWRMARDGRLPGRLIGSRWRFRREDIAALMGVE